MSHAAAAPIIAVDLDRVSKLFGAGDSAFRALDAVSVGIRENEFFTLLGPSGCGKTTLLRLIAGFDYPSSGDIRLYGEDIAHLPPFRRPVNTVFQSYALFPHMTVAENIGFGLEMLDRPKSEIAETVDAMLALVQMTTLKDRRISQISGGQQQRVALARALAPRPKVLLLDEPLSALDLKLRKEMQIELKRLQHETGVTFIFVTHDQDEALTMSDRVAVMNAGRILQVGAPQEIYERPADRFVADFIGETNFLSAEVSAVGAATLDLVLPGGRSVAAAPPEAGDLGAGAQVTLVVRPEHARLVAPGDSAALTGRLENIVYFGADTQYHVRVDALGAFIVRMQNSRAGDPGYRTGETVGIAFDDSAIQLLRD